MSPTLEKLPVTVITGFLAQFLYGLAAQRKLHYGWIFTAYGMMYFSFISLYTCVSFASTAFYMNIC